MQAITQKKHIITANKALLALHGEAIFSLADEYGVCVLFEGAGGVETASAVLSDLVDLAQSRQGGAYFGAPNTGFQRSSISAKQQIAIEDRHSRFYFRILVEDRAGVLAEISLIFSNVGVSINTIFQDEAVNGLTHIVITTHTITLACVQNILPVLRQYASHVTVVAYPILDA